MAKLGFSLAAEFAAQGDKDNAITMLRVLHRHLKDGDELGTDEKQYFMDCLESFLANAPDMESSTQLKNLLARSFNLVRKRKRPSRSELESYNIALQIDQCRLKYNCSSITEAVHKFINETPGYEEQARNDSTDYLEKLYRKYREVIDINNEIFRS